MARAVASAILIVVAQLDERITSATFRRLTLSVHGLKVSRPWLGYGKVLFLELGKLRDEASHLPGRGPLSVRRGQATILIHSAWRAEGASRFAFGIESPPRVLKAGVAGLLGRRVIRLALEARLPELVVKLDGALWVRSFRLYGPPDWNIFLNDKDLFPPRRGWRLVDHASLVGVSEGGQLQRSVCYDPAAWRSIHGRMRP